MQAELARIEEIFAEAVSKSDKNGLRPGRLVVPLFYPDHSISNYVVRKLHNLTGLHRAGMA
jgi:hypothetical protein